MKSISVGFAGQSRIEDMEITEGTTAQDVLQALGVPEYELSPGTGIPPFGKDEKIYDRVKPNGKILATPKVDVGTRR